MSDEDSATVRAIRAIKAQANEELFAALRDDFEYGNCPGTKLKVGNQDVWLYTEENVRTWLRACQKARREDL
jgi:hypothetical protein